MSDRRIAWALFVLTFITYAFFNGGGGWNQNVTIDVARAVVERGTIAIDAYATNTGDVSRYGGHIYSNKPPGLAFLALPAYALYHAVAGPPRSPFDAVIALWLLTIATCAVSGGALSAAIYLYARRREASQRQAVILALLLAFGTYLFAYSTVFFMHVPNALFLFLAFALASRRPLLAGVCAGLAILCNYLSLPAVAVISILAGRRGFLKFAAGAAPFVVCLMAYQSVAFGSPFRTSVEVTEPDMLSEGALFGVLLLPRLSVLGEILLGRSRGLFYLSPVLLFSIAGAVMMIRRRLYLRELAVAGGVIGSFLLLNMSFNHWHGGDAIGPRYILPVVPLLALPMLFGLARHRAIWATLGAVSIAVNFLVTAVNPMPMIEVDDPIAEYTLPLFLVGRLPETLHPRPYLHWRIVGDPISTNAQSADEIEPFVRHRRPGPIHRWASCNAGEFLWLGQRRSLIPIVLWMLAGGALLIRASSPASSARWPDSSHRSTT